MLCIIEQNNTYHILHCLLAAIPFSSLPNSSANFHVFIFSFNLKSKRMAPSRKYPNGLKIAVIIMMLFFSLTFFPSKSVGSMLVTESEGEKQMKVVLGSKPPRCVNRCLSCRPCMAALVVSQHHRNRFKVSSQRDESYYLLLWKCKCNNKFFQP